MGIKGIGQLQDLRTRLKAAADGELKKRLLNAAAAAALTQVQLGFRTGTDPDGKSWPPLKIRVGRPLRDTGRLANSFTSRATEDGFIVGTNIDDRVIATHQEGRTIVPVHGDRLRFMAPGPIGKRGRRSPGRWIFAKKVTVPQRKMVPADGVLPPKWRSAIESAANRAMRNYAKELKAKR